MVPQRHLDFLKALKMHDLAAEAKLYDLLSKQEPMPASFGGTGGKITLPGDPYCPRCGEYLPGVKTTTNTARNADRRFHGRGTRINIKELKNISEHDRIMIDLWDLMEEADRKTKNVPHAEEPSTDRESGDKE